MNNVEFFLKFLEDNKFSEGEYLHPEFIQVLKKYDNKGIGLMETIMYSIREYRPKLSHIEMAAVCVELSESILKMNDKLSIELTSELRELGIKTTPLTDEDFDKMVEEIKKEQSLV